MLTSLIGQVLDEKYSVERQLGQGGMGAVFLATHLGTGRPVAVKVISPRFMANEEFVARFRREARAAGLLRHPNIVNVTDFGFASTELGQIAYLVMEYLDGCTLSEVIKLGTPLSLDRIVDIIEQTCLAVERAHKQGIIHRDLKPDNIWLEPDERGSFTVKVLDFGLAKLATNDPPILKNSSQRLEQKNIKQAIGDSSTIDGTMATSIQSFTMTTNVQSVEKDIIEEEHIEKNNTKKANIKDTSIAGTMMTVAQPMKQLSSADEIKYTEEATKVHNPGAINGHALNTKQQQLSNIDGAELSTQVGAILGTPSYMSPEQCRSQSLDERSDIYSLGVILYEMLTGELPFNGSVQQLLKDHINRKPVPPNQLRKEIPQQINELVMSALEKDAALRPRSAASFANALKARAETAGTLIRNGLILYGQHFPLFFRISLICNAPLIIATILSSFVDIDLDINSSFLLLLIIFPLGIILSRSSTSLIFSSVSVPIVAQLLVAPTRAIKLKELFIKTFKRLPALLSGTAIFLINISLLIFLVVLPSLFKFSFLDIISMIFGLKANLALFYNDHEFPLLWRIGIAILALSLALPSLIAYIRNGLYQFIVMMEDSKGWQSLKRSRQLLKGSIGIGIKIILFYVSVLLIVFALSIFIQEQVLGNRFISNLDSDEVKQVKTESSKPAPSNQITGRLSLNTYNIDIFLVCFDLIFYPLITIVFALFYFRTRRINGETLTDILVNYSPVSADNNDGQALIKEQFTHKSSSKTVNSSK